MRVQGQGRAPQALPRPPTDHLKRQPAQPPPHTHKRAHARTPPPPPPPLPLPHPPTHPPTTTTTTTPPTPPPPAVARRAPRVRSAGRSAAWPGAASAAADRPRGSVAAAGAGQRGVKGPRPQASGRGRWLAGCRAGCAADLHSDPNCSSPRRWRCHHRGLPPEWHVGRDAWGCNIGRKSSQNALFWWHGRRWRCRQGAGEQAPACTGPIPACAPNQASAPRSPVGLRSGARGSAGPARSVVRRRGWGGGQGMGGRGVYRN